MEHSELKAALAQLHSELSQADQVDPEALELLGNLTADINRLLEQQQPIEEADTDDVSSGLQDLVLRFEVEHPQLASTLGKVADGLSSLGI